MNWTNLSLVNTKKEWQYTEPFEGDYIRIRHLLGTAPDNLPYGFTGLIAQAFDFTNTVELYQIKKIYPKNEEGIFQVINPFPNQERRLAVRGQRKFQTGINWHINIEFWQGQSDPPNLDITTSLLGIQEQISDLRGEFQEQINQSDAGIFTLATGVSRLLPQKQGQQLRQNTSRRLSLERNFL